MEPRCWLLTDRVLIGQRGWLVASGGLVPLMSHLSLSALEHCT